ncbi:hypothetical protein ACHAPI_010034 [Fusarium lateritium]
MAKWQNPANRQARTRPYAAGNTHPQFQQRDPMQLAPEYYRPHGSVSSQTDFINHDHGDWIQQRDQTQLVPEYHMGEPSQAEISNGDDDGQNWQVFKLMEERDSVYEEVHKLAKEKRDADVQIQNLFQEQEAANKRSARLIKNNKVLQDLVKTLKLPNSEDKVDRGTRFEISKLRRDLKATKAQLDYHLDHPYSNHVNELQEAEQRLLLANSRVRMLEGYLYGQSGETNQQQDVGVKEVRQRSNSF